MTFLAQAYSYFRRMHRHHRLCSEFEVLRFSQVNIWERFMKLLDKDAKWFSMMHFKPASFSTTGTSPLITFSNFQLPLSEPSEENGPQRGSPSLPARVLITWDKFQFFPIRPYRDTVAFKPISYSASLFMKPFTQVSNACLFCNVERVKLVFRHGRKFLPWVVAIGSATQSFAFQCSQYARLRYVECLGYFDRRFPIPITLNDFLLEGFGQLISPKCNDTIFRKSLQGSIMYLKPLADFSASQPRFIKLFKRRYILFREMCFSHANQYTEPCMSFS